MNYNDSALNADSKPGSAGMPLPPLGSLMKVELVVKQGEKIYLLHDKPYPGILKWVEYSREENNVHLVLQSGVMQELGLAIPGNIGERLESASLITVAFKNETKIRDYYIVPLVVTY